ncbi:hypothetical protein GGC63_003348 [Paenibacillus sp. OAS669]|nr:hypothetical protein [Paenibacillus sp. OAS669]
MASVNSIVVTGIEPFDYGHKRRVHMLDTKTGATYSMEFGSSVTEGRMRLMAPMLVKKAHKKRRGNVE